MKLNYKEDYSFFTTVFPPFVRNGRAIKKWFQEDENAKFRYIRDKSIDTEYVHIKQIQDYYPGVKTIGLVLNPWIRIAYAYKQLTSIGNNSYLLSLLDPRDFNLDTFEIFVQSLKSKDKIKGFWFNLSTPQIHWLEQDDIKVDYIINNDSIHSDFIPIQEYFCSKLSLDTAQDCDDTTLKSLYNEETKNIVKEIFELDIKRFGFKF